MLTERIAACPDFAPGRWIPCPPVRDRAAWDTLPGFDRWLYGGGEAARAARQIPPLPLHLWLDFTQTGNRARYEHAFFTRRRLLCRLVMAECMGDTGEYLLKIADLVWALCEESAWQLPAHNSYIRDTPAAAPAGYHPPHRGPVRRRDRRIAGHGALSAGRPSGKGLSRAGHPPDAGGGPPHPAPLGDESLLVDGQRGRTHVQLDHLVHPRTV